MSNRLFSRLNDEKKEMILTAAIKEFVAEGFEDASTNKIVAKAGISKGSLFNYFKSKQILYFFIVDQSIQVIEAFYQRIDTSEKDLFKRIENISKQKLQIHQKYPYVFDFLASSVQETSPLVRESILEKVEPVYQHGFEKMYEAIDYSLFRDDIDVEKAIEILNWTMLGFGEKGIKEIGSFENSAEFGEAYIIAWQDYADLLKYSFYK